VGLLDRFRRTEHREMVLVVPGSGASVDAQVAALVAAWCGDEPSASEPALPPGVHVMLWRAADPTKHEPANSAVWAVTWEPGGDPAPSTPSPVGGGDSLVDLAVDLTSLAADIVGMRSSHTTHDEAARTFLGAMVAGLARRTGGAVGRSASSAQPPGELAPAWVVLVPRAVEPAEVGAALVAADPSFVLAVAGDREDGWDAWAGDLVVSASHADLGTLREWTASGDPTALPWRAVARGAVDSWAVELSVEPDEPGPDDLLRGRRAAAALAAALGGDATDADGFPLGV
jgi:hypothetical protein